MEEMSDSLTKGCSTPEESLSDSSGEKCSIPDRTYVKLIKKKTSSVAAKIEVMSESLTEERSIRDGKYN